MTNKESILQGRARELADRYSTAGTEEMLTAEIVRLVKEYVQDSRAGDAAAENRMIGRRPNCF
jgi:hypothetical protein